MTGGRNLVFWGLTFVPPDGADHLLAEPVPKTAAPNQVIFPLFASRATVFKEAFDWIQFLFTWERTETYMVPASMVLFRYVITEGELLFDLTLEHLL